MKPYVYICTHKETGEFYIGYRSQNKTLPEQDIGIKYFTSSKIVKPRFHEFDVSIISIFDDKVKAHSYEQDLIKEHWNNPFLLNKALFPQIRHSGSEKQSQQARKRMLENNPMKLEKNKQKARERNLGKKLSDETKRKKSLSMLGKKFPDRKKVNQSGNKNPTAKLFIFDDPSGNHVQVSGQLRKFCIENNLGYNSMLDLGNNRRESYKGWTLVSKT